MPNFPNILGLEVFVIFRNKQELRIPGPVPVPPEVLLSAAKPMINHRGAGFKQILPDVLQRLQPFFGTKNPILPLTGSGTSSMEAAVVNVVSPGEKVLVLVGGSFGQRWAQLTKTFGAEVVELPYPWGEGVNPAEISAMLELHPDVVAIFATHNESSTGVLNDLAAIGKARGDHPALIVVDAVSSLGGTPVQMDEWGLDVVCTASQKCLMGPPGLAFIALSERARAKMKTVSTPRFYFNLTAYEQMLEKGETPFTPNLSIFFGLQQGLTMMEQETLPKIFARHLLLRDMIRAGIRALELPLLVADAAASPTTTAIIPSHVDNVDAFRTEIRLKFGVEFAGGQGKFAGKIFRVGHMGYATPLDMLTCLTALEMALQKPGVAVAAAEQVWQAYLE